MKILIKILPLLSLIISSCALNDTSPKHFTGTYQGTMTSKDETTALYSLNIVIDEAGGYLGTLNNINVDKKITMKCKRGKEIARVECVAINLFKSQVFRLYGSTANAMYKGGFEYIERGIKELEGDFVLSRF